MSPAGRISETPGLHLERPLGSLVLPGEPVCTLLAAGLDSPPSGKRAVVRLGSGATQRGARILSTRAGALQLDAPRAKLSVAANHKRYVPALEDMVLAVVTDRFADGYRLDLNATDSAWLAALAFEGASKKNRPHLSVGALVYCRVTRASASMEAEASCVEPGSNKSWVGGETLYGELKGGNVVQVSLGLARALLVREGPVLKTLGERIPFQSAVGINGRVWIQAASVEHTVLLSVAIAKADTMLADEWMAFVAKLLEQAT